MWVSIPGKVPNYTDANCISCVTTPQKSPPTQPQKTFHPSTLLPQHAPSLRVPFAGHPPTTHFVRQAQLSWRLLRRRAFVTEQFKGREKDLEDAKVTPPKGFHPWPRAKCQTTPLHNHSFSNKLSNKGWSKTCVGARNYEGLLEELESKKI